MWSAERRASPFRQERRHASQACWVVSPTTHGVSHTPAFPGAPLPSFRGARMRRGRRPRRHKGRRSVGYRPRTAVFAFRCGSFPAACALRFFTLARRVRKPPRLPPCLPSVGLLLCLELSLGHANASCSFVAYV